ncbi:MAG TPA: regulatory iron-sulfur-containing complex subunit RicT [Streptosporangiaceae bacterium]
MCCTTFLREFEPVSIRMAKDQDLPVNPMPVAGACGRLMCSLKYEHPQYVRFKDEAPRLAWRWTRLPGLEPPLGTAFWLIR